MAKILYIEDDRMLGALVVDWLEANHHLVEWVKDGQDALDRVKSYEYDILIVDLSLPEIDGLEVCQTYKKNGGQAPVLILSGRGTLPDKDEGFAAGADDYMTKPFDLKELTLRIRALTRRFSAAQTTIMRVGHIEIDTTSHTVKSNGELIHLAPMEFTILEALMKNKGQTLSSEALIAKIDSGKKSNDVLRTMLRRLRSKIDIEGEPSIITNVRGIGYVIDD